MLREGRDVGPSCPTPRRCARPSRRRSPGPARRSDGTLSLLGRRFEIPSRYRHFARVQVRYASWDLSQVHLVDPHTGTLLSRLYPLDKARNADGHRAAKPSLTKHPCRAGLPAWRLYSRRSSASTPPPARPRLTCPRTTCRPFPQPHEQKTPRPLRPQVQSLHSKRPPTPSGPHLPSRSSAGVSNNRSVKGFRPGRRRSGHRQRVPPCASWPAAWPACAT